MTRTSSPKTYTDLTTLPKQRKLTDGEIKHVLSRSSTHDSGLRLRGIQSSTFVRFGASMMLTGVFVGATVTPASATQTIKAIHVAPNRVAPHLEVLYSLKDDMGLSKKKIAELLNVSRPTLDSWFHSEAMRDANRKRLFAVYDVLKRAMDRYRTQGEFLAWLDTPRGMDGQTPAQLLAANEINRARSLALSIPSPKLMRAPTWVGRPVAKAFSVPEEYFPEADPPEVDSEPAKQLAEEDDEGEEWETIPIT